jgi:dihydroorotate dehydrogenase (NAD+) catalytic subunit
VQKRKEKIVSIKLSNGHEIQYVVASGALGFDGLGWSWERPLVWLGLIKPELFTVVLKTLTFHPRVGNLRWWKPWECVRLIPGGSVNKVGLTNPGIEWWCREVGPKINFKKFSIAGSIFGDEKELVEMAEMLNGFDLVALEVNVSCPNTGHAIEQAEMVVKSVKAVKAVSRHPIIVKLSAEQDYVAITKGLAGVIEAVSLNSVPWHMVFGDEPSPLRRLEKRVAGGGGGVSGKPAQKLNWRAVRYLVEGTIVPVIGPSIMKYSDLDTLDKLGAKAYSFGAIHLRKPWLATRIVLKHLKAMLKAEQEEVKTREYYHSGNGG